MIKELKKSEKKEKSICFSFSVFQSCDAMLDDAETQTLLNRNFDLAILDGAFPECSLGLVHQYKIPFMYINTVGFYTGSIMKSGNPGSYAITPNFYTSFTDNMNLFERALNTGVQIFATLMHKVRKNVFKAFEGVKGLPMSHIFFHALDPLSQKVRDESKNPSI